MKITSILFILIIMIASLSCNKKDNFNYPAGTVGISKIINFPVVAINGDRLIIINQNSTYTDAGATATLAGAATTYTTAGSVDASKPGVYDIVYTASNPEGYTASDWRTVVVIGSDVSANNFSGTYLRTATGVTSTWRKTANGVYSVENPGGAGVGVGLTVIAVNYTGTEISIPQQDSPDYGIVSSESETYDASASPVKYSWIFHAGGYGTSLRTFVKQ